MFIITYLLILTFLDGLAPRLLMRQLLLICSWWVSIETCRPISVLGDLSSPLIGWPPLTLSSDWSSADHSPLFPLSDVSSSHHLRVFVPLCILFYTFGDNYLSRGIKLMNSDQAAHVTLSLQHNDWARGIPLSYSLRLVSWPPAVACFETKFGLN